MKHIASLVLLLGVVSSAATFAADRETKTKQEPLTLSLSSSFASAPGEVAVRMRLEPDPRLRSLSIEWWTDDLVGGSTVISLDGDRAASRFDYRIKGIEAGEYVVTAVLVRDDGSRVKRAARLVVLGGFAGQRNTY